MDWNDWLGTVDTAAVAPTERSLHLGSSSGPLHTSSSSTAEAFKPPPRDVVTGITGGISSVVTGFSLGFQALVNEPIEGFQTQGIVGAGKGTVSGVSQFLFLSTQHVAEAILQVAVGVANTPNSLHKSIIQQQVHDVASGEWHDPKQYDLAEELEDLPTLSYQTRKTVEDTTLYDRLGVDCSVDMATLRKKYFQRSREVHPDKHSRRQKGGSLNTPDEAKIPSGYQQTKNQNPPAQHTEFQLIQEAYSVLSNKDSRAEYDDRGMVSLDPSMVSLGSFCTRLFGQELLDPYCGRVIICRPQVELSMCILESLAMENPASGYWSAEPSIEQQNREINCASLLLKKLEKVDEIGPESAKAMFQEEASHLAEGLPFAKDVLPIMARAYTQASDELTARVNTVFGVGGRVKQADRSVERWKQSGLLVVSLAQAASKLKTVTKHEEGTNGKVSIDKPGFDDSIPLFVATLWRIMCVDISKTIFRTVERVFYDAKTKSDSVRRMHGVKIWAQALREAVDFDEFEMRDIPSSLSEHAKIKAFVMTALNSSTM